MYKSTLVCIDNVVMRVLPLICEIKKSLIEMDTKKVKKKKL